MVTVRHRPTAANAAVSTAVPTRCAAPPVRATTATCATKRLSRCGRARVPGAWTRSASREISTTSRCARRATPMGCRAEPRRSSRAAARHPVVRRHASHSARVNRRRAWSVSAATSRSRAWRPVLRASRDRAPTGGEADDSSNGDPRHGDRDLVSSIRGKGHSRDRPRVYRGEACASISDRDDRDEGLSRDRDDARDPRRGVARRAHAAPTDG